MPEVAVQASLVTTLLPSRLRTYSLCDVLVPKRQSSFEEKGERESSYLVLQVPLAVCQ